MSKLLRTRCMKLLTAAVFSVGSLICTLPQITVSAEGGSCGSNTKWELSGSTLTISGKGEVETNAWSSVLKNVTSVVVQDGVTSLPANSFYNATMVTSVKMTDSVTSLGSSCFTGCSRLKTVELSDNLTTIPEYAFNMCISLTTFNFPEKLTKIEASAFYGCIALNAIEVPGTVTEIGARSFGATNIKQLTLNEGLKKIDLKAFALSCVSEVVIPDSVTTIGSGAFGLVYDLVTYNSSKISAKYSYQRYVTIKGTLGSAAETFAKAEGLPFENVNAEAIPEHTCTGEWKVTTDPTCLRDGEETMICEICEKSYKRSVSALGHSYSAWTVTKESTCTEYGEQSCSCERCGLTQRQATAVKGHNFTEWKTIQEPTLTTAGMEEHHCEACGAEETRTIPMLQGYLIQASAETGGKISPSGDISVRKGESQTFKIAANSGYQVANVVVDGSSYGGITEYTFPSVTANHSISVTFEKIAAQPTKSCTAITVTPIAPYWSPDIKAFASNSFKIIATITDGKQTSTQDISKYCSAVLSPSEVCKDGGYGVTTIAFEYKGTDSLVQAYAGKYGINGDVVIALKGDANYDGIVNETDAMIALYVYVAAIAQKTTSYTDSQLAILDVFENGVVDADDACKILRYFAKSFLVDNPSWDNL